MQARPGREPDVVANAAALRVTLRERAIETDRLARLPESTISDLEKARLFEITTPHRYGGLQLDVRTFMDAMVELGRGDAGGRFGVLDIFAERFARHVHAGE